MPALGLDAISSVLLTRAPAPSANSSGDALQVVCAYPVSGQYGPGTRYLYYVLVAACVVARKSMWLRQACLAAALLFPAVAAVHGIVLVSLHIEGAVDMDIYGAFQLCAIGILAAPVSARISTTYFFTPARDLVFLWTGLVLAGLMSLTVEFFRVNSVPCAFDEQGRPIDPNHFPYGNTTCGYTCDVDNGPFSPLRGGSANNINVIPAPFRLTFGACTLVAAACCIPAILSLIMMWNKISKYNWKRIWGRNAPDEADKSKENEPINGTNGATPAGMRQINGLVRRFLSAVEVPLFGGAVIAILVAGELNFWSEPVQFDTEPIQNIGQWSPILTTIFAILGAVYIGLRADADDVRVGRTLQGSFRGSSQPMREAPSGQMTPRPSGDVTPSTDDAEGHDTTNVDPSNLNRGESVFVLPHRRSTVTSKPESTFALELAPTTTGTTDSRNGSRMRAAKFLNNIADRIGTPAPDRYDDSWFGHGKAAAFPRVPGEEYRSKTLRTQEEQWGGDEDGNSTTLRRQNSRTGSIRSAHSRPSIEGGARTPGSGGTPQTPNFLSPQTARPRQSTLPSSPTSSEHVRSLASAVPGGSRAGFTRRRETTGQLLPFNHPSHNRARSADMGFPAIKVSRPDQDDDNHGSPTSEIPPPSPSPLSNPPLSAPLPSSTSREHDTERESKAQG